MIDAIDSEILNILQGNGRVSNAEIARQVKMAPSAVLERVRKLEERGVIEGYVPKVNAQAVGRGLLAYIFVRTEERIWQPKTGEELCAVPEVQEVHHIAGEDCFLVKVRTKDTESLGRLLRETFGRIESIRSTRTTIVLDTLKETSALPIDGAAKGKRK